jgi:hypothetical protein
MGLRGVAISLGIISAGMAATAFAMARGWHVSFGDVGTWLSGVGSFAAAVAALKIAGDEARRYNDERAANLRTAEERAVRVAKRIKFDTRNTRTDDSNIHVVALRNDGNTAIYDLTWHGAIIKADRSEKIEKVFRSVDLDTDRGEAPEPTFLNPGQHWRISVQARLSAEVDPSARRAARVRGDHSDSDDFVRE